MAAPNMFVHSVYVAALAFEDHRRDDPGELYLTHALDVAQALGPNATVSELSTSTQDASERFIAAFTEGPKP